MSWLRRLLRRFRFRRHGWRGGPYCRTWLRFQTAFATPRYVNHRAKHYRRGGWR